MSNGLPSYIASATPNPMTNRAPWYKNTAPTYAGIFLWFAFWNPMAGNGLSLGGVGATLAGIVLGAVICHYLFYVVPGLLGLESGLPLYVVGTSTFGSTGGLIMPGFLMGILQFGWLGVNTFFSAKALSYDIGIGSLFVPVCIIWALGAAFVGLKGIQYVAKIATYLPLIPLAVLLLGLFMFGFTAGGYTAPKSDGLGAVLAMVTAIVGFFATAGAAGVDFGTGSRDKKDVNMGGLVGILAAIVLTAGIATLAVAGAYGSGVLKAGDGFEMTKALSLKLPGGLFAAIMIGLTLASFPGACFSSLIAANSFKTVMPKVNPFLSVGIGALVSMILAITKVAGNLMGVFGIIGASFGPICGAMLVDWFLAGKRWSGPRAGFNPAGWIAWAAGFLVGILPNLGVNLPVSPVLAFIVGAIVYFACAKANLMSPVLPYGPAAKKPEGAAA